MITVGMDYHVVEGKEGAFEKKFALVMGVMNGMEGHVKTRLYKDAYEAGVYLVVSEWSSSEAYRAFVASEEFAKVTQWGKAVVLKSRPQHRVYGEMTDDAKPGRHDAPTLMSGTGR